MAPVIMTTNLRSKNQEAVFQTRGMGIRPIRSVFLLILAGLLLFPQAHALILRNGRNSG